MEMEFVVTRRVNGIKKYINVEFRRCKVNDFVKRKVSGSIEEFDKYKDQIEVQNLYNNYEKRISLSVMISTCQRSKRSTCVSN